MRRRKACSTSSSAMPTTTGCCCWTWAICNRCWPMPMKMRKTCRANTAMWPSKASARSSASCSVSKARARTCSSASLHWRSTTSSRWTTAGPRGHQCARGDKLMRAPKLYATFLLWLLAELFETLPEVGDPEKPKLVFFFDEAHLLFDDAPEALEDTVEQVVRLIRSKGVGVFFVTQNPIDIPEKIAGQLGNRVQHALRAFTPRDQRAIKAAAETFRINPDLDVAAGDHRAQGRRGAGIHAGRRRRADRGPANADQTATVTAWPGYRERTQDRQFGERARRQIRRTQSIARVPKKCWPRRLPMPRKPPPRSRKRAKRRCASAAARPRPYGSVQGRPRRALRRAARHRSSPPRLWEGRAEPIRCGQRLPRLLEPSPANSAAASPAGSSATSSAD